MTRQVLFSLSFFLLTLLAVPASSMAVHGQSFTEWESTIFYIDQNYTFEVRPHFAIEVVGYEWTIENAGQVWTASTTEGSYTVSFPQEGKSKVSVEVRYKDPNYSQRPSLDIPWVYNPAAPKPTMSSDKSHYTVGEPATFKLSAPRATTGVFNWTVQSNGKTWRQETNVPSLVFRFPEVDKYSVRVDFVYADGSGSSWVLLHDLSVIAAKSTPTTPPDRNQDPDTDTPDTDTGTAPDTNLALVRPSSFTISKTGRYTLQGKCGQAGQEYSSCTGHARLYELRPHRHTKKTHLHRGKLLDIFDYRESGWEQVNGQEVFTPLVGGQAFSLRRKVPSWTKTRNALQRRYGKTMRVRAYVWKNASRNNRIQVVNTRLRLPRL